MTIETMKYFENFSGQKRDGTVSCEFFFVDGLEK